MLSDKLKIKQVDAILGGEKRVHVVFCNHSMFRPVEECPCCKNLVITENMTGDEAWEIVMDFCKKTEI